MSEPKWTPGPWQACNTYHAVHGERVRNIALCGNAHIPQGNGRILVPDDEAKANARLIAAAPDLYEALELAVEKLREYADMDRWSQGEGGGCMSDPDEFIREAVEKAGAALRKARGEEA